MVIFCVRMGGGAMYDVWLMCAMNIDEIDGGDNGEFLTVMPKKFF
jgi:hypothetical protein